MISFTIQNRKYLKETYESCRRSSRMGRRLTKSWLSRKVPQQELDGFSRSFLENVKIQCPLQSQMQKSPDFQKLEDSIRYDSIRSVTSFSK